MFKYYIILIVAVCMNVIAQISLKKGALIVKGFPSIIDFFKLSIFNIYIWTGLFFYGIGFGLSIIVLTEINVNKVVPINFGLAIVLVSIIAYLLYGEKLSLVNIFGLVLIFSGILLVTK